MSDKTGDRRELLAKMHAQQALVSSNVRKDVIADLAKGRHVASVIDGKLVHDVTRYLDEAVDTDLPATTA